METATTILALFYTMVSYLIGIIDLFRLKAKMKEKGGLSSTSMEELGDFIGVHNWIFFPSVILVVIVLIAMKLIKKVLD